MFCVRLFNFHKIFQILLNFKLTTNTYSKVYILYTLSGHNCMFPPFISFSCTHVQKDQLGPTLDVNGSCQIGANTQNIKYCQFQILQHFHFWDFEKFVEVLEFLGLGENTSLLPHFWTKAKIFFVIFQAMSRIFDNKQFFNQKFS